MNFVTLLIRMFARQAIFQSGRKLFQNHKKGKADEDFRNIDTSDMTPREKKMHENKLARMERRGKSSFNPWILVLLIVIGFLVLYISTMKK